MSWLDEPVPISKPVVPPTDPQNTLYWDATQRVYRDKNGVIWGTNPNTGQAPADGGGTQVTRGVGASLPLIALAAGVVGLVLVSRKR